MSIKTNRFVLYSLISLMIGTMAFGIINVSAQGGGGGGWNWFVNEISPEDQSTITETQPEISIIMEVENGALGNSMQVKIFSTDENNPELAWTSMNYDSANYPQDLGNGNSLERWHLNIPITLQDGVQYSMRFYYAQNWIFPSFTQNPYTFSVSQPTINQLIVPEDITLNSIEELISLDLEVQTFSTPTDIDPTIELWKLGDIYPSSELNIIDTEIVDNELHNTYDTDIVDLLSDIFGDQGNIGSVTLVIKAGYGVNPQNTQIEDSFTITIESEPETCDLIEQAIQLTIESQDTVWKDPKYKVPTINKLEALLEMCIAEEWDDLINKLNHDLRPKLTGKKVDGKEFKNAWIINPQAQQSTEEFIDNIISSI